MDLHILPLEAEEHDEFKRDMQDAFQKGAADEYADKDVVILPGEDIDKSLSKKGSAAYKAVLNGEMVGGAIVVVNEETQRNRLDFLYVKYGVQSKGIGKEIWRTIERIYSDTKVWETYTPYFEKRNLHFYINQCGFHIVEFYNPHHNPQTLPEEMTHKDYFFRFEKKTP